MDLLDSADDVVVSVTRDELRLLANSINETLEVVEEWEFSTRLGASSEDARVLRDRINGIIENARHRP